MEHLLFAGYLSVCAWLVTKVGFFKRSGLTAAQLVILLLIKVMAGIFYGWIGMYYGGTAKMLDTWSYHYQSLPEAKLLLAHPTHYFSGFFHSGYSNAYGGFLGQENSWWNDLDVNLFIKLMGVFNALSFGYYYIDVIFYSVITLFGPVALYRVFNAQFPGRRSTVLLAVFFIPSFIYWTSGLHKEGLLFNSLALIIYTVYFGWKEHHINWRRIVVVCISILLLLALRSFMLLVLLPALIAWVVALQLKQKPVVTFCVLYILFASVFFAAPYINSNLDFPAAVAGKQQQFLKLSGGSEVPVRPLQPNVHSFIINAPQAVSLAILRPYFSDIRHLLSMAAAIEINSLLLLFALYVFLNFKHLRITPFSLFCLFFSFSTLLMIGYTVNFLGAIVRYRSIILPLLFVPALVQLPWQKGAQAFLNIRYKNNVDLF